MNRKNIRVMKHQFRIIRQEMENNPELNNNKLTTSYSAQDRRRDWEKLAKKLNSAGGAVKTVKAWQKCWSDHKSNLKSRHLDLIKERKKPDEGGCIEKELTPEEEKVLTLMGKEATYALPAQESEGLPQEENEVNSEHTEKNNEAFDAGDASFPTLQEDTSYDSLFLTSRSQPRPPPPPPPRRAQQASLTEEVLQSANECYKQPRSLEDRFNTFGKHVSNVLRDVPTPQRILAEKFINDVLFMAQMGTLTSYHVLTQVQQNSAA